MLTKIVIAVVLVLAGSVAIAAPAAVFVAGQRVRLKLASPVDPARVAVTDYAGLPVAIKARMAGELLDLGVPPPGFYRVAAGSEGNGQSIAVVPRARHTRSARLNVDAAHAWLIPPDRFDDGAQLLALAGVQWVRERMNWGEVERSRGQFSWGRYDEVARAERARGLRVYQVFHSVPAWSRADGATNRYPDDLLDVYRFCEAASKHYADMVEAWEVWNEADIPGFSVDPASEYAAFLKAAYLGFKAGRSRTRVTQVSLALASPRFHENLYRNGTQGYFDIFNYHIYADPAAYAARAAGHFAVLDHHAVPALPVWLTEAGVPLRAVDGGLSPADQRRQAEFIPKSLVASLAAGTDRHFFFVFPHYLENGVEFGLLDGQMRPYPGYAALASAIRLLGEARYRGSVPVAGASGVSARLVDAGDRDVVVAWSDGGQQRVTLPLGDGPVRAYNCVGTPLPPPEPGTGRVELGPAPIYLVARRGAITSVIDDAVRRVRAPARPASPPPSVVVRVRPRAAVVLKGRDAYQVPAGLPVALEVQLYNFSGSPVACRLRLTAPDGWTVSTPASEHTLPAMGRAVLDCTLTAPRSAALDPRALEAVAEYEGRRSSPAVLDFALDPATLAPSRVEPLPVAAAAAWRDNVSDGGTASHEAENGEIRFAAEWRHGADRWTYPSVEWSSPRDWSAFDAITVEVAADADDLETTVRLMVVEEGGATYFTETGFTASKEWRRVVVPLADLAYGPFSPADPNGKLDLDRVTALRLGANTSRDRLRLRARDFRLLQLRPR